MTPALRKRCPCAANAIAIASAASQLSFNVVDHWPQPSRWWCVPLAEPHQRGAPFQEDPLPALVQVNGSERQRTASMASRWYLKRPARPALNAPLQSSGIIWASQLCPLLTDARTPTTVHRMSRRIATSTSRDALQAYQRAPDTARLSQARCWLSMAGVNTYSAGLFSTGRQQRHRLATSHEMAS